MPTYCINLELSGRDRVTVSAYLSNTRLRPAFSSPETRIPELIRCQGLVHYTRSGIRTVVTDSSFEMQPGDFLVVAESCSTGGHTTFTGNLPRKDQAIIMPDDIEDPFALHAENYFHIRPNTNLVGGRVSSLDHLVRTIYSDDSIHCPINDIFFITHANPVGMIFPKDDRDANDFLDYDELCEYTDSSSRPQITSRVIQDNCKVNIRGCKIGQNIRYITKIRELFGDHITVTAPKHFDTFGFSGEEITEESVPHYEYMSYGFTVFNKTRINSKNALIQSFLEKHFTDIHGIEITRGNYNSWIPANVNDSVNRIHRCDVPIPGTTVERRFIHRVVEVLPYILSIAEGIEIPDSSTERKRMLRSGMSADSRMSSSEDSHEYPFYERYEYSSFDEFWDGLQWSNPQWDPSNRELSSTGRRHEYEIRVPITGPNTGENRLMLNAFLEPDRGQEADYLHHDIVETDTRFFSIVP